MTNITYLTLTDLQNKAKSVYERYPELFDYIAQEDCRHCQELDIEDEFGKEVAIAWDSLYWYDLHNMTKAQYEEFMAQYDSEKDMTQEQLAAKYNA